MSEKSRYVIAPEALKSRLGAAGPKIVDASWYLPAQGRDAHDEYRSAHIPGAVFFDQDEAVDPASPLPHALPKPEAFAAYAGKLGITERDDIVVYDGLGMFSAPRVWWLFKVMGAKNVMVLDGGFDNWRRDGFPVTTDIPSPEPATFEPDFDEAAVARLEDVMRVIEDGSAQIADARPHGRFTGQDPEPRQGMRSGHMPGAFNVPATSLSKDGHLKDLDELAALLKRAGVDPQKPVITSCGSGVTAAVITLALHSLGHEDNRLYDGSWSEWGSRQDTPVNTGEGLIDSASSPRGG